MLKGKNYWIPVFDQFSDDYPDLFFRCEDWYPSAQLEIVICLDNGEKYTYDFITRHISSLDDRLDEMDEEGYRILFGKNLRKRILRAHITQEELADRIGISQSILSRYLNGKALPNPFIIRNMSRVLQCSVGELVELSY